MTGVTGPTAEGRRLALGNTFADATGAVATPAAPWPLCQSVEFALRRPNTATGEAAAAAAAARATASESCGVRCMLPSTRSSFPQYCTGRSSGARPLLPSDVVRASSPVKQRVGHPRGAPRQDVKTAGCNTRRGTAAVRITPEKQESTHLSQRGLNSWASLPMMTCARALTDARPGAALLRAQCVDGWTTPAAS